MLASCLGMFKNIGLAWSSQSFWRSGSCLMHNPCDFFGLAGSPLGRPCLNRPAWSAQILIKMGKKIKIIYIRDYELMVNIWEPVAWPGRPGRHGMGWPHQTWGVPCRKPNPQAFWTPLIVLSENKYLDDKL